MYDNVIVTDIDGVMMNWEHGFHMWMLDNGYQEKNVGFYDIQDKYGISVDEANSLMNSFNESAALRRLPPIRDAIKYVRKLHEEHGYVFHGITAIPDTRDMYEARMENIHNLFGKTVMERLTLCGSSTNKKKLLGRYDGSECYWLEDLSLNASYGIEYGLRPILMDHHYNKNDVLHSRIKRVYNWKEIYLLITENNDQIWYK
jgi:5'(3')-deoxyribonucleotidase